MEEYDLSHLNILVVEDNKYMQSLLKGIMRTFQLKNVRITNDGEAALFELKSFVADLIIADWSMKPMDGLTFVRRVRTDPESTNPYVPVIMMTGHTEKHRVNEARDAGITEFLAKPISPHSLYQRICMVIERPRQFVKTETYTGPDRRRQEATPHTNKGRRASDKRRKEAADTETAPQDGEAAAADDAVSGAEEAATAVKGGEAAED